TESGTAVPRVYAAIHGARVVFGQREASVAQALDVLDGKAGNLSKSGVFPQLGKGEVWAEAAGSKLKVPGTDPNAAVLKQTKAARFHIGQTGDNVTAEFVLDAENGDGATAVAEILRGLIALGKLNTDHAAGVKVCNALHLTQDAAQVTVTLNMPATEVVDVMKTAAKQPHKGHKN
ncbi:MAG: hypothetical protein JWO95_3280, partial [Verrucomicrobiales bacterium]|nr:hypothetical protein [Verrucomicrobiales bacterium]